MGLTLAHHPEFYRQRAHTLGPEGERVVRDLADEVVRLRAEASVLRDKLAGADGSKLDHVRDIVLNQCCDCDEGHACLGCIIIDAMGWSR